MATVRVMMKNVTKNINKLIDSNADDRENVRWDLTTDYAAEIENIQTWLNLRLIFIDNYINTNYLW